MADRKVIESIFAKYSCTDFKWMDPQDIVVSAWIRYIDPCIICGESILTGTTRFSSYRKEVLFWRDS